MIKSFTIQNFKSILDLTIDFTYNEGKAPNGYKEMETLPFLELGKVKNKYIRMVPCMALYGANAKRQIKYYKSIICNEKSDR